MNPFEQISDIESQRLLEPEDVEVFNETFAEMKEDSERDEDIF